MSDKPESISTDLPSAHSGSAPTWITNEYLEDMLKNSLKDDSISVSDFEIGPGSAVGDNYACQIFRIKINCTVQNRKESKGVIIKALPKTSMTEELVKKYDFFEVEVRTLSETLPLLLEVLNSKIKTEKFFPEFYKVDRENQMLFMEDLKADGYVLADRKQSLDLDHVVLVVKALAKLHAASYLFFKKNPDFKNKYLHGFFEREEDSFMEKLIKGMSDCLLKSLHLWPISEEDKETFRKLQPYDLMVDTYKRQESSFNVLIHGDCWVNNMMFKYENGKVASVKLIDFQLPNHNSIGLDLNYFLMTSAKEYVKMEHLEEYLQIYHHTFVSVAGEVEGFTMDTVRKEFIERLGYGFSVAMLFRAGMLAEKPFDLEAYFESRESESNSTMYQNESFIREATNLLPLFKKHGVFKQ